MMGLQGNVLIFTAAILVVSSGQGPPDVCKKRPVRFFNTADRLQSISLGAIKENSYIVPEDSSTAPQPCQDLFRTIDGTCNHPDNLGSSFKPTGRILPPAYDDDENSPRGTGVDGQPLSGARLISRTVHPAQNNFTNYSIMVMQWGQWIDHDVVATAQATAPNGSIVCCGPQGTCPPFITNRNCFPIEVPENDTTFSMKCIEFVRSLAAEDTNGKQIKPREQVNSVTSFIDGSQIYGSTNQVAESLRVPGSFLLKTKKTEKGDFLPESPNANCIKESKSDHCFLAGDVRVNQQPYLSALHTIFLRDHNRIANNLKAVKPSASNDLIFHTTRKIISAILQIITYNAWLPIILGRDASRWGLLSTTGRSFYNPGEDPRIFSSFSTAAFRFGHSTIPSVFPIGSKKVLLRDLFNRPGPVLKNLEDVVTGMCGVTTTDERSAQAVDRNFVEDVSKFLFKNPQTGRGFDLVTFNIQRGRDHGVPSYTKFRRFCGLRPLTGFNDTAALGPHVNQLRLVYRSVDDIDLFTGIVHEPADVGMLGPTGRCLMRIQFLRLKIGDRFFFNNDEPKISFTDAQLAMLRKVTLSKVICHNTNLKNLTANVFRLESSSNPLLSCSDLKKDDVKWELFI